MDDCGLNACGNGNCVDKVNGYMCDCDEDYELMFAYVSSERHSMATVVFAGCVQTARRR